MKSVIISRPNENTIIEKGMRSWPVWTKEVSSFPWTYDCDEECLILEGEIIVSTEEGEYQILPGDFVVFKKGLKCRWTITSPVRKHYNFI